MSILLNTSVLIVNDDDLFTESKGKNFDKVSLIDVKDRKSFMLAGFVIFKRNKFYRVLKSKY